MPPHLSISHFPTPTDSPRSGSSSTLILASAPPFVNGNTGSTKLVGIEEGVPSASGGVGVASPRVRSGLRLKMGMGVERMGQRGFIEPHRNHLPRRATTRTRRGGERRGTVGEVKIDDKREEEDEKEREREEYSMWRRSGREISLVHTHTNRGVESWSTATTGVDEGVDKDVRKVEDEDEEGEDITERPAGVQIQASNLNSIPFPSVGVSPLGGPLPFGLSNGNQPTPNPPNSNPTSITPSPPMPIPISMPLASPSLPHPAMGLTMGLMEAAQRACEDEVRVGLGVDVEGGVGRLGEGDEDQEVGFGYGLGGPGGLGGLGLGVSVGVGVGVGQVQNGRRPSPLPVSGLFYQTQTGTPFGGVDVRGMGGGGGGVGTPNTAAYSAYGVNGVGGGGTTSPMHGNLPRRHHRRGRDRRRDVVGERGRVGGGSESGHAPAIEGTPKRRATVGVDLDVDGDATDGLDAFDANAKAVPNSKANDSLKANADADADATPGPKLTRLATLTQPRPRLGYMLTHGREDSMDVRGRQGEGEVRVLRVERGVAGAGAGAMCLDGNVIPSLDGVVHDDGEDGNPNADADVDAEELKPKRGGQSVDESGSGSGTTLSIERRMRSVGSRVGGGVVREEVVAVVGGGGGGGEGGKETLRKEEGKRKDRKAYQVIGWSRVEVGFLCFGDGEDGGGEEEGRPYVELRVVDPFDDDDDEEEAEEGVDEENGKGEKEKEKRRLRLYLPGAMGKPLMSRREGGDVGEGEGVRETEKEKETFLSVRARARAFRGGEKTPYQEGVPSLSAAQIREGCAFMRRWLGPVDDVRVRGGGSSSNGKEAVNAREDANAKPWIRILAPRWRPEDAFALALCWGVGVEGGFGSGSGSGLRGEDGGAAEGASSSSSGGREKGEERKRGNGSRTKDGEEERVDGNEEGGYDGEQHNANTLNGHGGAFDVTYQPVEPIEHVELVKVVHPQPEFAASVKHAVAQNLDVGPDGEGGEGGHPAQEREEPMCSEWPRPLQEGQPQPQPLVSPQHTGDEQGAARLRVRVQGPGPASQTRAKTRAKDETWVPTRVVPMRVNDLCDVVEGGEVDVEGDGEGVALPSSNFDASKPESKADVSTNVGPDAHPVPNTNIAPHANPQEDADAEAYTLDPSGLSIRDAYSPYHLLSMRLLDDDQGWLTRGRVGLGLGVVVVKSGSEGSIGRRGDLEGAGEGEGGGVLIGDSNKDTAESSLEDWKLRGDILDDGGGDVRGRQRKRQRALDADENGSGNEKGKGHVREGAFGGAVERSPFVRGGHGDHVDEEGLEKQPTPRKREIKQRLGTWTGLRDEWRGVLSYEGLMVLARRGREAGVCGAS